MIVKVIGTIFFVLSMIVSMYGTFHAIRENEKELALIFSFGSALFGMMSGILLGSLLL